MSINKVDIRPGVSVLAVLRHLNYRPWFSLGEFVDNSVQSFLDHRRELEELHGQDFKLGVEIDIDLALPARISIRDNAAGPAKASGDAGSVEQHKLADQIDADRYLCSKDAAKDKRRGLRFNKLVPPGTV